MKTKTAIDTFDLKKFSHFLFDYDGLLVDSERLYFETWAVLLTDKGKGICKSYHEGRHESEVYQKVRKHLRKDAPLHSISDNRKKMFDTLVAHGRLKCMDGIPELLHELKSHAPLSIVSNSRRNVVEDGLMSLGIQDYFGHVFCFSNEINRKPAPDLYNLAASTLNIDKVSALALEDSQSGIIAAQAAGIPVICISAHASMKDFCHEHQVPYVTSAQELRASS